MGFAVSQSVTIKQKTKVKYLRRAEQIPELPPDVAKTLDEVSKTYVFRANNYYLNLIDWDDPADPIRQLIIPRNEELHQWGKLDASNEAANTVAQGVQHKYSDTALVLVNSVCGAYCRYCFRKRLFMDESDEWAHDLTDAHAHIASHPEITDVLLTGGDPLIMNTPKLRRIVEDFASIPHVRTIRLGTKMPAFNPFRFTEDDDLMQMFQDISSDKLALYVMAHFDHPRELTPEAALALLRVQENGGHVVNQCPIVRGVNDDPDTLAELFQVMTQIGAPQYYLFQGRPTVGNEPYEVPMVEGWQIFDAARRQCSGLSRRVRLAMSHETGKIEILGVDEKHIYLRYHRAKNPDNESRMIVCKRDDSAFWLDQLEVVDLG